MPKFQTIDCRPDSRPAQDGRKLLSRSSLLVLSGILVGMGVQPTVAPAMQSSMILAAGIGMLSFISLGRFGQSCRQRAAESQRQRASQTMERRLRRHIPRGPHIDPRGQRRRHVETDRQYVTVVRSSDVG